MPRDKAFWSRLTPGSRWFVWRFERYSHKGYHANELPDDRCYCGVCGNSTVSSPCKTCRVRYKAALASAKESDDANAEIPTLEECRPEIRRFACHMERVLCENDHKGGWWDVDCAWLMMKLVEEFGELAVAYVKPSLYDKPLPANWQKELVDVANLCMMLADRSGYLAGEEPDDA